MMNGNNLFLIRLLIHLNKQGGKMFEERMKQLKAEQQNLNMRMAEINFLIQGYETAIKEKEKAESDKKKDK